MIEITPIAPFSGRTKCDVPRSRARGARRAPISSFILPPSSFRRGVSLPELLIALAISAAVLASTAVAIHASLQAYQVNQEQSDLMQRARLAVHRITAMIRQTKLHAPVSTTPKSDFAAGKTVTDTGVDMFDLQDKEVRYSYNAATKQLIATVNNVPHVLVDGVEAFTVTLEPMRSATSIKTGGSWDLLKRASITLNLKSSAKTAVKGEGVGHQTLTLSASVMPRRNAW